MQQIFKISIKYVWLIFILINVSCIQHFISDDPESTPENNFEHMWDVINKRYSYFELKGIDWDSVYDAYRPLIKSDMNDTELFDVLADMLFELHDGHVNLTSDFNRSRNWDWFLNYESNFNQIIISNTYLGRDYLITGPFHNQVIDSVLYVRYASFADDYTDDRLDELIKRAQKCKGVIIDIRSNGGGKLSNASRLAAAFAKESIKYAQERVKTGSGNNDFSPWTNKYVNPRNGEQFTGNVIVICNRSCYSASSFFALMMRTLPNATLIGDQTGGGGGVPAFCELPNGWSYRFSATQTINPEGEHIEPGVPVDIVIQLEENDEQKEIDTIIEYALDLLKNQNSLQ